LNVTICVTLEKLPEITKNSSESIKRIIEMNQTNTEKLKELIERFKNNIVSYKSGHYNETQVRREFIDPLFKLFDWDVDNEQGYAEAYKDVVHEDAIKIGGKTKAPDYCFRIGGTRKFFVEAKKPSINIKDEPHPAYQLRRYAWSAKLPLSILTDFEEFAVYDCRIKPEQSDSSSKARVLYITYDQYESRWEEIFSIFSRSSILKGSFDRYAESNKSKKGTAEVDTAFLEEISSWREILARNIALRNPELSQRELNFSIQMIIDRIIFLRICEDRGIENYGRLQELQKYKDIYKELTKLFQQADDRYNSGLFHFRREKDNPEAPDDLTLNLTIDDKTMKDILKNLYYPESPYEFSVLPAEILGQIYEQFLGKIIAVSPGRRVSVEEKPEVKKAGGVYYTPTYIVDYIVKETVGKFLEGKTPKQVEKITILDPACGSGSFLIGAYQYLLDWHKNWYVENNPEKWAGGKSPKLYQTEGGDWFLTTGERKKILLNNIYGVDIDNQAVEVTKLSLLLKVLEGESDQRLATQLKMFQERALPNMGNNIKCGNSLIGTDFFKDNIDMAEDELYRINPFDWQGEFPEVMKNGGFDVVIGNPPYVRQELLGDAKTYFQSHYKVYHGTADLYAYFIEKSISLLKHQGLFGIIVANKWMRANYGKSLREWLKQQHIIEIIDFGDLPVFQQATTYPCIIIVKRDEPEPSFKAAHIKDLEFIDLKDYVNQESFKVKQNSLDNNGWNLVDEKSQALLEKLKSKGIPLEEYVNKEVYRGIVTGFNEAFVIDISTREKLISEDPESEELIKPFLVGKDIKKYQTLITERYVIFTRRGVNIKNYPAIESYLKQFKEQLMPKPKDWKGENWQGRKPGSYQWYEIQDSIDYYQEFEKQKIIYPNICKKPEFTYDEKGLYTNQKCFIIPTTDKYLLGILNSSVMFFLFRQILPKLRGDFYEPGYVYFKTFPIRKVDFSNSTDKIKHEQIVELVNRMLISNQKLSSTRTPQEKNLLQRQIEMMDRQINKLVYELYELTEEEIKIIEESA